MVEINGIAKGKIDIRLDNYLREANRIEEKVNRGKVSPHKEERIIFRYIDIKDRLLPKLAKEMPF